MEAEPYPVREVPFVAPPSDVEIVSTETGELPAGPSGLTRDELRRCSPFRTESRRLRFRSSLSFRSVNPRLTKCTFRNAQVFRSRAPRMARVRPRKFAQKFRITYLCSRSCERSEQFARVPTRRARFLYSKIRTRPGERINEAKRNVSREERVAEHRRRLARRGAEWLHGVMRSAGRWQKQLCVFVVND